MYTVITDAHEIEKCQHRFIDILTTGTYPIPCRPRFPKPDKDGMWATWDGTTYRIDIKYNNMTDAWWSDEKKMWLALRKVMSSGPKEWRYWNVFGFEKPKRHEKIPMVAQINFLEEGAGGQTAGTFVKDGQGKVAIIHSCRFRKGKQNITLKDFIAYGNQAIDVKHPSKKIRGVLVGELESPNFSEQVRKFLEEVSRIKEMRYWLEAQTVAVMGSHPIGIEFWQKSNRVGYSPLNHLVINRTPK